MSGYCPTCANFLLVESRDGQLRYFCQTCPFIYNINNRISRSTETAKKHKDVVLSSEAQMSNAPKTTVTCSKCNHDQAYFTEVQTRSADEPATLFFTCVSCGHKWKEG